MRFEHISRGKPPARNTIIQYHYTIEVANGFILLTQIFAISELNR